MGILLLVRLRLNIGTDPWPNTWQAKLKHVNIEIKFILHFYFVGRCDVAIISFLTTMYILGIFSTFVDNYQDAVLVRTHSFWTHDCVPEPYSDTPYKLPSNF